MVHLVYTVVCAPFYTIVVMRKVKIKTVLNETRHIIQRERLVSLINKEIDILVHVFISTKGCYPGGHPKKPEPSQILLHLQQLVVV